MIIYTRLQFFTSFYKCLPFRLYLPFRIMLMIPVLHRLCVLHNQRIIDKNENLTYQPTVVIKAIPIFFRIDDNNPELVYCKICELNLKDTNKKPYAYTRKGGNTTSMINHLRDKHNITKDNYTQYLDEHSEVRLLIYQ